MNVEEMRQIVHQDCSYKLPNSPYTFLVTEDSRGSIYLHAEYYEPDSDHGGLEKQRTRRWFLSPYMTRSELVQTVFKCVMTSMEHRAREWFCYKGRQIFGPHFDVDELRDLCDRNHLDKREK